MSDILQPGAKAAKKASKLQEQQIGEQRKKEELALAESEDVLARRKAATATGGRKSLIATSQTGVSGTLGGT
jgi:hypothetical protein